MNDAVSRTMPVGQLRSNLRDQLAKKSYNYADLLSRRHYATYD